MTDSTWLKSIFKESVKNTKRKERERQLRSKDRYKFLCKCPNCDSGNFVLNFEESYEDYYKNINFHLNKNKTISLKPTVSYCGDFETNYNSIYGMLKPIAFECENCMTRFSLANDKIDKNLKKELDIAEKWIIENYVHFKCYKKLK